MARKKAESQIKEEKATPQHKSLSFKVGVKCKNNKQKELLKSIQQNSITICQGVFGVGKSYVIGAAALKMLKSGEVEKIICIVPTVEVGDMHLGLMPGDLNDKMGFHILNEVDCFVKILTDSGTEKASEVIGNLINTDRIEFRPISNLRGASFRNSVILVSEAEEFTKDELFLIITRYETGKMIISGDPLQSSRRIVKNGGDSGLIHACEKLKEIEEIGIVEFSDEDIVRNDILLKVYKAWKNQKTDEIYLPF